MTTSNAVVGSSAMTSLGSQDKAKAIIALCFIPPDNSCGNLSATDESKPTIENNSLIFSVFCSFVLSGLCSLIASLICSPTFTTGFHAFIAPWKTILIPSHLIFRKSFSDFPTSSIPSKRILPFEIFPFSACSCNKDIATDVFPQPDSPTIPNDSPAFTLNDIFLTASTLPSMVS